MVYNPLETALIRRAKSQGAETICGLEMFLEQAARQFEIWTGETAPRAVMEKAALEALAPVQAAGVQARREKRVDCSRLGNSCRHELSTRHARVRAPHYNGGMKITRRNLAMMAVAAPLAFRLKRRRPIRTKRRNPRTSCCVRTPKQLAKVKLPIATEPAFSFKA